MPYSDDEKQKIWRKFRALCDDADQCEKELQAVLSSFNPSNDYSIFKKLDDIHYIIDRDVIQKKQGVVMAILGAMKEYQYFNQTVSDKGHFDSRKIQQQFQNISRFLPPDTKIRIPLHPSDIYSATLYGLIEKFGVETDTSISMLNIIFDTSKKKPPTSVMKKSVKEMMEDLEQMDGINKNHLNNIQKYFI